MSASMRGDLDTLATAIDELDAAAIGGDGLAATRVALVALREIIGHHQETR